MFRLEKRKNAFKPGFPAGIYLFKVNKRNPRKKYEICSKLTNKDLNDANGVVLVPLLLTSNIFQTLF